MKTLEHLLFHSPRDSHSVNLESACSQHGSPSRQKVAPSVTFDSTALLTADLLGTASRLPIDRPAANKGHKGKRYSSGQKEKKKTNSIWLIERADNSQVRVQGIQTVEILRETLRGNVN